MECPYINKSITEDEFNKPINYKDIGGSVDYIFYEHNDGFGQITNVQFCKKAGRKKDVFECLNEDEWRYCFYYFLIQAGNLK